MIYTPNIEKAIDFAIETHEINQKQKRKGKDIPYISHPFTVGLILAKAGVKEEIVIAGLLHDTIEDSVKTHRVTKDIVTKIFGEEVATLVASVTEADDDKTWEERKAEALGHIEHFSNDSVLLKSADVISNVSEIYSDYQKEGEKTFDRFSRSKEKTLDAYYKVANALFDKWPASPLSEDLKIMIEKIKEIK